MTGQKEQKSLFAFLGFFTFSFFQKKAEKKRKNLPKFTQGRLRMAPPLTAGGCQKYGVDKFKSSSPPIYKEAKFFVKKKR